MENLIPIFIALTGAAVLLQACLLAAMYLSMRKSGARIESLATEVRGKALPALETAQSILTDIRPKLQVISDNLQESAILMRAQVERVDATVSDVVDRARLQVIRADELLTRTLDRVEKTTDMVHTTVISPIRQVSGVVQGITAGIEFLLGNRYQRNGRNRERRPVPQDEMFI
jgi:tetrahydromethanopterin S-methyltransferase subunit F